LIDVDVNAINFALYRLPCNSRQTCTAQLKQVETATEALLSDLTNAVVPSGVGPTVEPFKSAAQQFEEQVDGDLVVVEQSNTNYTAASPMVGDLFLAAATFDCWPSSQSITVGKAVIPAHEGVTSRAPGGPTKGRVYVSRNMAAGRP
jgi:hypothetical protein